MTWFTIPTLNIPVAPFDNAAISIFRRHVTLNGHAYRRTQLRPFRQPLFDIKNNGETMPLKRILREHAITIAIALIPALYLAINPSFGQNQAGEIDTWFYLGLAKSFWHQLAPDFNNDYYETRLPYIIPAAIIFTVPSERVASLILSYLIYCTCAFSFFYVLSKHVSKPTALLATFLIASDIFFMRTVGWQYVDSGVVAYGSLAFAALTAASATRHRYVFVCLTGFCYTSMVITHLGSAPLGLAVVGYGMYVFDIRRKHWSDVVALVFCAAVGAISCQVFYGLLNIYLYQTTFFFEGQQIAAAKLAQTDSSYFKPLSLLLTIGWWLTLHIAVWLAAGIMIIAKLTKLCTPTRFQSYCMWAVFSTYSILFSLDFFKVSLFLQRDGLYASFYLFLPYLFIGSILPNTIRIFTAIILASVFLASLFLRYTLGAELARELPTTSAWAVGITLGVLLAAVGLVKNRVTLAFSALAAAMLVLPISWPFRYEPAIYAARDAVKKIVGDRLPHFAFSESDPIYQPVIIGLIGSFTPRAWWIRCSDFPDCLRLTIGRRTVIVVSSNIDSAHVSRIMSSAVPEARLSSTNRIERSKGDFSLYSFTIPKLPVLIPGSKLPSLIGIVEAGARVALEGTGAGYLTYGPYATLDPGHYEVTITYESEGETGSWDIITASGVLAKGSIPDTRGTAADIVAAIDLPNGAEAFEARTLYSGHGRLSILNLAIQPITLSPEAK